MFGLVKKFLSHVVPGVVKPLHILWNEVIGFLFLVFAVLLIRPAWHSINTYDGDVANFFKMILSIFFALVMAAFGLQSFWKARKIRKS
jgi:hypothetical protein